MKYLLFATPLLISLFFLGCSTPPPQPIPDTEPDQWEDTGALGSWRTTTGFGLKEEYALVDAWKKAMQSCLEDNIDYDYLETRKGSIDRLLTENWQSYTSGDWRSPQRENIVYGWDREENSITIRVRLKEDKLLYDVDNLIR